MKKAVFLLMALGTVPPLSAQTLLSNADAEGRAYGRIGLEPASVVTIGYQHVIPVGLIQRDVNPYVEWTVSMVRFGGDNSEITVGGVVPLSSSGRLKLLTNLHLSAGALATRNFESRRFAGGDEMAVGFYSTRWFLAATGEYEHVFLARLEHTDFYRTHYYDGAVDGWYWDPGGTFQIGLEGGWTIRGRYDIHLEAKVPFTEEFNAYGGSPLHVNLGVGKRFGR